MRTKKTKVYINLNNNNENFEIFCLQVTGYLNTRKSFPNCMFVVMATENVTFIYIALFYKNSNLHTYESI